jgi:hypothetical protein
MNRRQKWGIAAAALVAFTAAGVVAAPGASGTSGKKGEEKKKTEPVGRTNAPGQSAPRQPNQRVFVDPATGKLFEPTDEQIHALEEAVAAMLSQETEGLEPVEQPDGTIMLDLQDRFNEIAIATISPSGEVSVGCVDHPRQVKKALQRKPAPTAKPAPPAEEK